jgi:hypothetical protein
MASGVIGGHEFLNIYREQKALRTIDFLET